MYHMVISALPTMAAEAADQIDPWVSNDEDDS